MRPALRTILRTIPPLALGAWLPAAPPLLAADLDSGPVQVRTFVNDSCLVADEPYLAPQSATSDDQRARFAPLVGIVVGKLAEALIKYVAGNASSRIKSAAGRKDTYYAYTREMNLFRVDLAPAPVVRLNGQLGCMTIVTARKFMPDKVDCSASYVPKEITRETMALPESEWKTSRSDDSVENQLRRANICVDGLAVAVYEARFEFSPDGTAYRLKNAGYRVNSLATAVTKGTTHSVFYTLEISTPGQKNDQHDVISTAWVNVGPISAGARSDATDESPPWLHVPAMSADARRAYEEQTRVHHEVAAEIDAGKRSITRNQRVVSELDGRIASASPEVAEALKKEKVKDEVQIQVLEAEVDARTAEYQSLPQKPMEFMPVTIQVGITESRSEKASLVALADVINTHSSDVASAGGNLSASLLSRSVDPVQAGAVPRVADPDTQLDTARAAYYDTLVDYKAAAATSDGAQAREKLADARLRYNQARRAVGLEAIQ
jgi:hypothetical protein